MPPVKSWKDYPKACDMTQWKKTCKKKYQIWVCMPKLGTKVYNKLEDSSYRLTFKIPQGKTGKIDTIRDVYIDDEGKLTIYTSESHEIFKTVKGCLPTGKIV